jgi:diadenosine tetraphosphate (Ap4A) HIT family hydrolase
LKEVAGADLVYAYIFGGGVAHFHVHVAPHREGDALNDQIIRGEIVERKHPSGVTEFISKDFPPLPPEELRAVADRIAERLASFGE